MTKLERRYLFGKKLSALICLADAHDIRVAPFAIFRTAEEQHKLFLEGKSACDGYEKKSKHQGWLACDLAILNDAGTDFLWVDPRYDKLGELAEKLGLTWGGRWQTLGDIYHVEYSTDKETE
jgi:peptidoglycan L-alanyl-D-glutamate endopeptidase CwlK